MGIRQAASHAYSGNVTTEDVRYFENLSDTLYIQAVSSSLHDNGDDFRIDNMTLTYTNDGDEILLSDDVRFNLKKSKDSLVHIEVRKEANGSSRDEARETAGKIDYMYKIEGNTILLDNFLTTASNSRFKDQEVRVNLYLPIGMLIKYDRANSRCWNMRTDNDRDIDGCDFNKYTWKMGGNDNELICLDCPEEEIDEDDEENKIIINKDGIDINIKDENGESFKMKINEDGVNIEAKENNGDSKIIINEDGIDIDVDDTNESFKMKIGEDGVQLNNY